MRHIVITPAHNEEALISHVIESMTAQTSLPELWVVVDDHSTDGTAHLVDAAAERHRWIRRVVPTKKGSRVVGSHVARLFLWGLEQATTSAAIDFGSDWDFVSKIEADLTLPPEYFEQVLSAMRSNDRLGIAGGSCVERRNGRWVEEKVPEEHTRGALKTYRRACYNDIGGVRPVNGWDGIDGVYARMRGWETQSYPDLKVRHHRPTGTYRGVLRGRFLAGQFAHYLGYHPLFMAARMLRRTVSRPYVVGGLALGAGYLADAVRRLPMYDDEEMVDFLRQEQLGKLKRILGMRP